MSKVLFYGDHPQSPTANAYFNQLLVDEIQKDHEVACLCFNGVSPQQMFTSKYRFNVIPIGKMPEDAFGMQELVPKMTQGPFDIFVSNNDIWRLFPVAANYTTIHRLTGFSWVQYFPCDADVVKPDWIEILNMIDLPMVYSQHGYKIYSPSVPKLQYLRPIVKDVYKPFSDKKREEAKKLMYPDNPSNFVVGMVARNQVRKDLPTALESFKMFSEKRKDAILYLHMEPRDDWWGWDLMSIVKQLGITDKVVFKSPGMDFNEEQMNVLYNSLDVLLVTSVCEGLCLPIVEAQLCNIPVVAANNSAMTELVDDGRGYLIDMSDEIVAIPILARGQRINDPRRKVKRESVVEQLESVYSDTSTKKSVIEKAYLNAREFTKPNHFKKLFNVIDNKIIRRRTVKESRRNKILYVQYQSAGDVVISTGLLEPLKKKEGKELDYMVGPRYKDILIGNPHISEIVDWDFNLVMQYAKSYNPHKLLLSGNWGSGDANLYDIYSRLCQVEYGKAFVDCKEPGQEVLDILKGSKYITISSMGGHPHRWYPYFQKVMEKIQGIPFVQIGGPGDPIIMGCYNLCGRLSFRESAWVIKNSLIHIGVDTFQAHLAASLDKPQVVLYGPASSRVVRPRGFTIDVTPNYVDICPIIGPCSGAKQDCDARCMKSHHPDVIVNCTNILIEEVDKGGTLEELGKRVNDRCLKLN
jgi:glycosyltransferase involved in cell wall biosynthesis